MQWENSGSIERREQREGIKQQKKGGMVRPEESCGVRAGVDKEDMCGMVECRKGL